MALIYCKYVQMIRICKSVNKYLTFSCTLLWRISCKLMSSNFSYVNISAKNACFLQVGSLAACIFGQKGHKVQLYESRPGLITQFFDLADHDDFNIGFSVLEQNQIPTVPRGNCCAVGVLISPCRIEVGRR